MVVVQVGQFLDQRDVLLRQLQRPRACPAGGAEQANAISPASTSPAITDSTRGLNRCLWVIVVSTSPLVSTNRCAIGPIVSKTPTCRATHRRAQVLVQPQEHPSPHDHPRRMRSTPRSRHRHSRRLHLSGRASRSLRGLLVKSLSRRRAIETFLGGVIATFVNVSPDLTASDLVDYQAKNGATSCVQ